jgi:RecA-family ATPase
MIIVPWLPDGGLPMTHGKTGYGKSWLGLTVGVAVAYGQDFLGFTVPSARKVLVIDGEM